MDGIPHARGRGRGFGGTIPHRGAFHNKQWVSDGSQRSSPAFDAERRERGGHRGGRGGRGRGQRQFPNQSFKRTEASATPSSSPRVDPVDDPLPVIEEPELETQEERDKFYRELEKAREVERKVAIAEGRMDDPLVPKRLEDAISIVGTCPDMCPRFERYRRERQNNLFEWEQIPGTKRVNHNRAVKMYERAAGDKTIPSDLRPPIVLKKTLDYLFHDLIPRGGFSPTFNFIRDRSRSVRNDFTMQHNTGALAIECHDRCARFHILALHHERDRQGFSIALEEQQLMNTLQSLKEFYEDQRGKYQSATELEMRVYHRLIHIRDQKERAENIPPHITSHPVFKLTTDFRLHVQKKSAPITKTSSLAVDEEGMQIFMNLAQHLRDEGSVVMIYLVACILERHFGKDTIDDIEGIRGSLSFGDIIDGESRDSNTHLEEVHEDSDSGWMEELGEEMNAGNPEPFDSNIFAPQPVFGSSFPVSSSAHLASPSPFQLSSPEPPKAPAFGNLTSSANPFGTTFGATTTSSAPPFTSAFAPVKAAVTHPQVPAGTPPAPQTIFSTPPAAFAFNSSTTSRTNAPTLISQPNGQEFSRAATSAISQPPNPYTQPTQLSQSLPAPSAPHPTITNGFGSASGQHGTFQSPSPAPEFIAGHSRPTQALFGSSEVPTTIPNFFAKPSVPSSTPIVATNQTTPPNFFSQVSAPLQSNGFNSINFPPPLPSGPLLNAGAPVFEPRLFNNGTTTTESLSSTSTPQPQSAPGVPVAEHTPPLFSGYKTPATPSLPKLNTTLSPAPQPATPIEPPSAPRHAPVSLPSTPVATSSQSNPLQGYLKSTLSTISLPVSSDNLLSPLNFNSPSSSKVKGPNFPNVPSPLSKQWNPQRTNGLTDTSTSPLKSKGKGKARAQDLDEIANQPTPEHLLSSAVDFCRTSLLARLCFKRWKKKIMDRAAWLAAVKSGESYRSKLLSQSHASPRSGTPVERKRLLSSVTSDGSSPVRKRAKKRVSTGYRQPLTDEDLAKRFRENQDEHQRRWAEGSFLQVIQQTVDKMRQSKSLQAPKSWRIWLSMNPENDGTAIWLEKKFDVPTSGNWETESVFSIPLAQSAVSGDSSGFPGLVVFECTPQEGLDDELERKYRTLEDCTRLRDLVNSLPSNRHFIPSLILIHWSEKASSEPEVDFMHMVSKLASEGQITGHHLFTITTDTKDLDEKLAGALHALNLDIEGRLVKTLSVRNVFKLFDEPFGSFVSEWLERCILNDTVEWVLYFRLLQSIVDVMNDFAGLAAKLVGLENAARLPSLPQEEVGDDEMMYTVADMWLAECDHGDFGRQIAADMVSHHNMGISFPAKFFINHLHDFIVHDTETLAGNGQFFIPTTAASVAEQNFKATLRSQHTKLTHFWGMNMRRSPKRRALSEVTDISVDDISPKRRKLISTPVELSPPDSPPGMNGHATPSPSLSVVSLPQTDISQSTSVTLAMLRALTQDARRQYAV